MLNILGWIYWPIVRSIKSLKRSIRYLLQRRFYGCSDKELWYGLDIEFLKWLYKRLVFLHDHITDQYPNSYNNVESWKQDIQNQIKKIDYIFDEDGILTNNEILYQDNLKKEVLQWFANNAGDLWL